MNRLITSVSTFLLGLLVLVSSQCPAWGQAKKPPTNVRFTTAAWADLEKGNFDAAIKNAKTVIEDFEPDADVDQEKLKKAHAAEPPLGTPTSKKEEQDTLKRGPLNDVATCHWIIGQAYEKKGDLSQAKLEYQAAAKYTYARTWDPEQGLFWSPADKASARLKRMK